MSESKLGTIGWIDLTVADAEGILDFYKKVTGWQSEPVAMGEYNDHCLRPAGSESPVAGICHKLGSNSNVPSHWIIYITVADVDSSAKLCVELGGKIIEGPRNCGESGRFCIIEDPAGAVAALYSE